MITYSRLAARIWVVVDFFEPAIIRDLKREEFESLDHQILQWYDSVPEAVKITNFDKELPLPSTPSYNLQRLQIWTRLRLNQIRIWLYTPVLHSASSINDNMDYAQRVVELAKDTIRYLDRLNNSSNLYRRIQVFYHQFLTSAIAVIFLASTHQPVQFSASCRDEFYMAMNLVKDMSAKSWVSQRLWRTIRSLKTYAQSLGLQQQEDDHLYLAMAGRSTSPLATKRIGSRYTANSSSQRSASADNNNNNNNNNNNSWQQPTPPPPLQQQQTAQAPAMQAGIHADGRPPQAHSQGEPGTGRPGLSQQNSSNSRTSAGSTPAGPAQVPVAAQQQQQQGVSGTATALSSPEQITNGLQIKTEMTRIFEGYMGMSSFPVPPAAGTPDGRWRPGQGPDGCQPENGGGGSSVLEGETVYEQLKSMF